ncbi:MAG: hypothetical protein HONBIEJF_01756 [Fimbriimonadaceae bacterium]|nr:hypothetical protein [Fimbriimonadaceae bacterium]
MIKKWNGSGWEGIQAGLYKTEPGSWKDVARSVLHASPSAAFQARYFEVAPGGFSSFERHEHEHFVMVVCGRGSVQLGDEEHRLEERDIVGIPSQMPHQFRNDGEAVLGILCIVDSVRDRPTLLGQTGEPLETSKQRA